MEVFTLYLNLASFSSLLAHDARLHTHARNRDGRAGEPENSPQGPSIKYVHTDRGGGVCSNVEVVRVVAWM